MKKKWLATITLFMFALMTAGIGSASGDLQKLLLKPNITDEDLNGLYFRALDDPRKLVRELASLWRLGEQSQQHLLQARAGWMLGKFSTSGFSQEVDLDFEMVLLKSLALVSQEKLPVPLSELAFYRANVATDLGFNREAGTESPLLELVEKVENQAERNLLLARIASAVSDRGNINDELARLLSRIRKEVDTQQLEMPAITIQTLMFLRESLLRIDQKSEAESINGVLTQQCSRYQMRSFCALRDYEAGIALIRQETRASAEASKAFFKHALKFSLEIDDKEYIANSNYGLSLAYTKTQVFDEAMRYGYIAYESYVKLGKPVWAASTLKNLASSLLDQRKPEEALPLAEKALALCPPEYSMDIIKIYDKIAEIYKALGRYREAFEYSQLSIKKAAEMNAEDADRKYMELRNETLTTQNAMQQTQIQLLNKFRMVSFLAAGLSVFLCGALVILWKQGAFIRESRQKMKQVLDHLEEGIAVLDKKLTIEPGYSACLGKLFAADDRSLEGKSFLKLVFPEEAWTSDQFNMTRGTLLTCMGENAMTWNVNKDHLPYEIVHGERLFSVHWQPLYSSAKVITTYLVSLRDMTELRGMQKQAEMESERAKHLQDILEEIVRGKVSLIRQTLGEIRSELPAIKAKADARLQMDLVMRKLHTWKGGSRTLGLRRLAEVLHGMENQVVTASATKSAFLWEPLFQWLEHYEHILSSFEAPGSSQDVSAVDIYSYASLYAQEVEQRLARHGAAYDGIWILDRVLHWKPEVLPRIHEMLIHAVSNSLDHGFIQALQKGRHVAAASIRIQAECDGGSVILQVIDNGCGLDWVRLRQKAEKIGFVPKEGQPLSDVLFLDGVSTAETVSETSGRGVGLSAIRSLCLDLSGTIVMNDAVGGGTHLRMEFPRNSVAQDMQDQLEAV